MSYIKIDRDIKYHWITEDAEFFRAWVLLVALVNWKKGKTKDLTIVERGETITSERKLCDDLILGRKKLKTFLNRATEDKMISVKSTRKGTTIKVLNYDTYQDKNEKTGTTEETTQEPQKNHKGATIEEGKKLNKYKINLSFDERKFTGIEKEDIEMWKNSCPAVNIEFELNRMISWLISNPSKRKKDYKKFITNWLFRTQDQGGTKGYQPEQPKKKLTELVGVRKND